MSDSYVIIIPSRLASTRLPRKALADICGKSLIQRVYEVANKTRAKNVYIATDDNEIFDHVKNFSENVIMTSKDHISGTDRIHEAANELNLNANLEGILMTYESLILIN
jgi:3-deoxy-manno-octulosonate cytidylyltransferase (CMP-KDO synthetase)